MTREYEEAKNEVDFIRKKYEKYERIILDQWSTEQDIANCIYELNNLLFFITRMPLNNYTRPYRAYLEYEQEYYSIITKMRLNQAKLIYKERFE